VSGEEAISGCSQEGEHDGEYIIFTTAEKLQASDTNGAPDVYEWHCAAPCTNPATEGTVAAISDGVTEPIAAMSASGSDIFFGTSVPLVGQDIDSLSDVYDARMNRLVNGSEELAGFPAPPPPGCSGEACLPPTSPSPSFGPAPSSQVAAGGNLLPSQGGTLAFQISKPKPKPLTRAQELSKALKACKGKANKKKREACESQARTKYGAKAKAKKRTKAKKSNGRGK